MFYNLYTYLKFSLIIYCLFIIELLVLHIFLNIFSERFLVKISKEGFSNYIEKLHNNCTIFTVSLKLLITLRILICS
jgi:hypothetical protein